MSILIPSYFSSNNLCNAYKIISSRLERESIPFELLIIDDGSEDDSFEMASKIEESDDRVRAYKLSKNFTTHNVRFAAFSICRGDCYTTIPDDLQLPINTIVEMYRLWEKGYKIIVPYRASRKDGRINDFFSNLYYKIMNSISEVKFPPGGADGFLIDREIIDILNEKISPLNTSTIIEVLRLGYDPIFIPFDRPKVKGKSRWTLRKKLRLALDTILSSSNFPIKLIAFMGLFSVILSFFLILMGVIIRVFFSSGFLGFSIPGWTTNFVLITFFSGLILFSLGIIAEYIWRIYEEVKGRPAFIIRKKEKPPIDEKKKEEKSKEE